MRIIGTLARVALFVAFAGPALLSGGSQAGVPAIPDPSLLDRLPSSTIAITSDRCMQLEMQFDAVKADHASSPSLGNAQSLRDKGADLCNADVDEEGAAMIERALRTLGVVPDPEP